MGLDCSNKCAADAQPAVGDATALNSLNGNKQSGEGGLGFGDMARGIDETIDSVPDQIADSQEQMLGGKGSETRAWSAQKDQKDVVDLSKTDDPFAKKANVQGLQAMGLGLADGRAYGLDKPDLIKQEAQKIADEMLAKKYS